MFQEQCACYGKMLKNGILTLNGMSLATKETSNEERKEDSHVATWMELCIQWLNKIF